jgi:hypothetical protein
LRPLAVAPTEFHFYVLYSDRIQAVSRLSKEVVWQQVLANPRTHGTLKGLARDALSNSVMVYSDIMVWELKVQNEDVNVWRHFLETKQYDSAAQYCRTPQQKQQVLAAQADHYYSGARRAGHPTTRTHARTRACAEGSFELAAVFYAKTSANFEEIALKFMAVPASWHWPLAAAVRAAVR